ncbi:MAG: hypothetical protein DMD79_13110 [Candidatus Rokuibacteriota bacterium]|nr:MAG: hypothetical protein DMD79_13110 [Candidatus Rokubacteria bacterium]
MRGPDRGARPQPRPRPAGGFGGRPGRSTRDPAATGSRRPSRRRPRGGDAGPAGGHPEPARPGRGRRGGGEPGSGEDGRVFVVHPRGEAILDGVPTVRSVEALPGDVDVALVAVPPEACEPTLRACGARGIRAAIVFTSGFAEAGETEAERRLVATARAAGVRVCGPNTLGVVNPDARFYGSFSGALVMTPPPGGEIAYLSQSGALGGAFMSRLWERGIGICRFVSVGNQADLDLGDYVGALLDDPGVRVLALFVEGVADGRKFGRALGGARGRNKPVVVYKAGRTRESQGAIRSHTGALAGDDVVWTVRDVLGLFDAAIALAWQPPPAGRRVGIISTSGGACGILADECRGRGLLVPELGPAAQKRVEAEIPRFGVARNPIDVTAQMLTRPEMFGNVLGILAEEPGIDAILLMLTTLTDPLAEAVMEQVVARVQGLAKPVLVSWLVAPSLATRGMARLIEARIPLYDTPERAVNALAALAEWPQLGREV